MKVLLAVDSSPLSEAMIDEVLSEKWPEATEFCVLTVIDLLARTASVGYLTHFAQNENRAAEMFVKTLADRLRQKGLSATPRVIEGHPISSIVDCAADWGANLIALGSHGHGGLARFFLGSVARGVLHKANCSVRIIRPAEASISTKGPAKILLATDGAEDSLEAVRSIAERMSPRDIVVRVVSVAERFVPAGEPWHGSGEMIEEIRQAKLSEAARAVASAEDILQAAGFEASGRVLEGNPKSMILDEATQFGARLIIVGSHGRRGLSRLILGSVSEAVAMRAHCSVEVIRASKPLE
jgi:nucleotide-binding universal stress UspA family protein